jgi:hypothetical protein
MTIKEYRKVINKTSTYVPNLRLLDDKSDLSCRSRRFKYKNIEYKWKTSERIKNNLYVSRVIITLPQISNPPVVRGRPRFCLGKMVQRKERPAGDPQLGRALGTTRNHRSSQHLVLPEGGMVDASPAHRPRPFTILILMLRPIICIYLAVWYP